MLDPFKSINATPEAQAAFEAITKGVVQIKCAADITPEPINWIWNSWLAAGKVHVLGGAPGTGKTTISMALAATVTMGGYWPDGSQSPVGNVVIWSGEDDPADTLVPRLTLSGADLSRVIFISGVKERNESRSFDPAHDMEALKRKLAASMRCALLGITHFSKGTGGRDPVERLTGSLAFGAVARVVLVAAKHQEEGEDGRTVRLFLRAKSNIGPDDGGFEYDLLQDEVEAHPGVFASAVRWGNTVEGEARELLTTAETALEDGTGESVVSVTKWLRQLLSDEQGEIDRRDVMKAAHAMGYKERTVHRAREKIGIIVKLHGFGKDKRSMWTLSNMLATDSYVPYMPNKLCGTNGTYGGTHQEDPFVEVEI
jgi:putative DNA primase/helicase